jgi:nitrate/TMAO reductase-like tetraheme cytochrome c subunit
METLNRFLNTWIIIFFTVIGFLIGYVVMMNTKIVIQKSSDSDWEYSNNQNIENDTTITEVKIIGRDTLYPTVQYKVIARN